MNLLKPIQLTCLLLVALLACSIADAAPALPARVVFDGVKSVHQWPLKDLNAELPADWTGYNFLVIEMRTSTPQRFSLWLHTTNGSRRVMLQPFGQGVWLRASIPLQYLRGRDQFGHDLASVNNRRTDSFWMSVWGPFGDLKAVESLSLVMRYPINKPVVEIRSVTLAKEDPGSDFLEKKPVLDQFGQWAHADWPGKIKSQQQLESELAKEEKSFQRGGFDYCELGGYRKTQAKGTGFFRVEQIDGKWWFIDPHGHYFLSVGANGIGGRRLASVQTTNAAAANRIVQRLDAWGFNTGVAGQNRAYITYLNLPKLENVFLGLPDVYSESFARTVDEAAASQCAPRKNDQLLIGYFVGNEPPWDGRESDVADMILAGPATATRAKLKEFLAGGDTPARRKQFVIAAFEKQLELTANAIRKQDPNHLNLGIRFGGEPSEEVLRAARFFDVCSINVYEYEPTKQLERTYRLSGRPVLIGEFHFGVPEMDWAPAWFRPATKRNAGKRTVTLWKRRPRFRDISAHIGFSGAMNRCLAGLMARITTLVSWT